MIRYEILSNTASSEQGLHRFPELQHLVQALHLGAVEAHFVRHVRKVEGEVHLSTGQFARGLTVKSRSTREVAPHLSLSGAMSWARSVLARPDRGMHLHLDSLRAVNSAPFAMSQVFARRQRVFVSGVDANGWARLCAVPDLTCKVMPEGIAANEAALKELLQRRSRPAGFVRQARTLAALPLLPAELRELLQKLAQQRDATLLQSLTGEQVVNMSLLGDLVERYQPLLEEFCGEIENSEALGDLGLRFDQLNQGISLRRLHMALAPLVPENRRGKTKDKRALANDVRIGLRLAKGKLSATFRERLGALVYRERARQDGPLYAHATPLPPSDESRERTLQEFIAWLLPQLVPLLASVAEAADAELPPPVKEDLFTLLVGLVYRGQWLQKEGTPLSQEADIARGVLEHVQLPRFDIAPLRRLNPRLPPTSYSRNLAQRVPCSTEEAKAVCDAILEGLFPVYPVAAELVAQVQGGIQERESARVAHAAERYLMEGYPLLRLSNYILGRGRLNSLQWRALLSSGRGLGLSMVAARDEVGASGNASNEGAPKVLGHTLLLRDDTQRLFPLKAPGELLYRAYRHLNAWQVAALVRRFVSRKLSYLVDRHGALLFELLYHHVTWDCGLQLSRMQFGNMLLEARVFEPERLRSFGFSEDMGDLAHVDENPLFSVPSPGEAPADSPPAFTTEAIEAAYREAEAALNSLVSAYGNLTAASPAKPNGGGQSAGSAEDDAVLEPLGRALAGLVRDEILDLRSEQAVERLSATAEAALFGRELLHLAESYPDLVPPAEERREAVMLRLPGKLAHLVSLRAVHDLALSDGSCRLLLVPAPGLKTESLDAAEQYLAHQLEELLQTPALAPVREALERLVAHDKAWRDLQCFSDVALVDLALRGTLLALVKPRPPAPEELAAIPTSQILLMAPSAGDAARFHRLAQGGDAPPYETLSGLSSELSSFQRLRDELDYVGGLIEDLLGVIRSLNVSDFEAPHLVGYRRALQSLRTVLRTPPEDFTPEVLTQVETLARDVSDRVRDIYTRENALSLRNRWLTRIAYRLRTIRPNSRLTFADRLFERTPPAATQEDDERKQEQQRKANEPEFQTFSERVRQLLAFRERLEATQVFVLSPAGTQQRLAVNLIEHLFRLKGLEVAVLVDTSNCSNYLPVL